VMHAAGKLGLVGSEFMWLGTSAVISASTKQPSELPLGMIGEVAKEIFSP